MLLGLVTHTFLFTINVSAEVSFFKILALFDLLEVLALLSNYYSVLSGGLNLMHNCFLTLEFKVTFGSMFCEYTQSNRGGGLMLLN